MQNTVVGWNMFAHNVPNFARVLGLVVFGRNKQMIAERINLVVCQNGADLLLGQIHIRNENNGFACRF